MTSLENKTLTFISLLLCVALGDLVYPRRRMHVPEGYRYDLQSQAVRQSSGQVTQSAETQAWQKTEIWSSFWTPALCWSGKFLAFADGDNGINLKAWSPAGMNGAMGQSGCNGTRGMPRFEFWKVNLRVKSVELLSLLEAVWNYLLLKHMP